MDIKLFDSEWKLMELLWEQPQPISAKALSLLAAERIGWNKNTTYTVVKKLVEKGAIQREEPGFICHVILQREDAQRGETQSLISRIFDGSKQAFFSHLLADENLSQEDLTALKAMIEEKSDES